MRLNISRTCREAEASSLAPVGRVPGRVARVGALGDILVGQAAAIVQLSVVANLSLILNSSAIPHLSVIPNVSVIPNSSGVPNLSVIPNGARLLRPDGVAA